MSNEKVNATFHPSSSLPEAEQVVAALRKKARREWLRGAAAPLGALVVGLVVGAALAQSPAAEAGPGSGTSGSAVSPVSQEGCVAALADADRIIDLLSDGLRVSGQAFGAVAEGRFDDLPTYSAQIRANTSRLEPLVETYKQEKEACS